MALDRWLERSDSLIWPSLLKCVCGFFGDVEIGAEDFLSKLGNLKQWFKILFRWISGTFSGDSSFPLVLSFLDFCCCLLNLDIFSWGEKYASSEALFSDKVEKEWVAFCCGSNNNNHNNFLSQKRCFQCQIESEKIQGKESWKFLGVKLNLMWNIFSCKFAKSHHSKDSDWGARFLRKEGLHRRSRSSQKRWTSSSPYNPQHVYWSKSKKWKIELVHFLTAKSTKTPVKNKLDSSNHHQVGKINANFYTHHKETPK